MTRRPEPPPVASLTYAQYSGWACCWCAKSLLDVIGAVSVGRARGQEGAHVQVHACPDYARSHTPATPSTPKLRCRPRRQRGGCQPRPP